MSRLQRRSEAPSERRGNDLTGSVEVYLKARPESSLHYLTCDIFAWQRCLASILAAMPLPSEAGMTDLVLRNFT